MSNILSYTNILNDITNFKNSGTNYGSEFNIYDMPSHKYFKLLFYFGDVAENANEKGNANGLLHPTWQLFPENNSENNLNYYDYNSAWAFLKLNDENERAEKLKQFVTLLSDINSLSPWYFLSVGGIDSALERKVAEEGALNMSEQKTITINCINDAFDNRIGTLLELYRDITWSWVHKKEIIPANLRKFDMAIYIFEAPERSWHKIKNDEDIIIGMNNSNFRVSYKMIEFHDCEINYNSIKSGWSELSNETGFTPKYNIEISYSDCYEISYNDIMMRQIGDIIVTDLFNTAESVAQENSTVQEQEIIDRTRIIKPDNDRIKQYNFKNIQDNNKDYNRSDFNSNQSAVKSTKNNSITYLGNLGERNGAQNSNMVKQTKIVYEPGFISNVLGQVAGTIVKDATSLLNKAVLGNLYGYSLTQVGDYAKDIINGNLIPALHKSGIDLSKYANEGGQTVKDFMKNLHGTDASSAKDTFPDQQVIGANGKPIGDIFPNTQTNNQKPNGNIFQQPQVNKVKRKPIKGMFRGSTIANNL